MEGKWTKISAVATVFGLAFGGVAIYLEANKNPPDPTNEVKILRDDLKRIAQERAEAERKEKEEQRIRDLERAEAERKEKEEQKIRDLERAEAERKEKEEQRIRDFEKEIASLKGEDKYYTVSLQNKCSEPITVIVHYLALNNMWVTAGWWKIEPDRSVRTNAATRNHVVYFYAKSDSYTWHGENKEGAIKKPIVSNKFMRIGSETLEGENLREVYLLKKNLRSEGGLYPMKFTCGGS